MREMVSSYEEKNMAILLAAVTAFSVALTGCSNATGTTNTNAQEDATKKCDTYKCLL